MERGERGGRGLLVTFHNSFPPASEREARMDDPTRRCENDTGNETHSPGLPIPSGGPIFVSTAYPNDPLKKPTILRARAISSKKGAFTRSVSDKRLRFRRYSPTNLLLRWRPCFLSPP